MGDHPGGALDLSLYLVTDAALCGPRGVAATVRDAVAGGVSAVQLRDPGATTRDLLRTGAQVREVLAGTGVPLFVNDRADVAYALSADGVHLGQSDLPPEHARDLLGPGAWIGLSVHAPGHLDGALTLPPGTVDYLGVGPVFAQTTKADAASPGGLALLADLVATAAAAGLPCVAIGGIGPDNAAAVRATGVAGIAVVSAVCGRPDPAAAARALRTEVR
ncbi:thiamine phosphate synthase [Actinopolymorpha sp. NPDC004070]|uniref:thiamine phosphate synthase n=1 Tax=Actinopolymorpha sp. NPDC004070 TaxID=3154548 RepID=UPI0033BAD540